MLGAGIWRELQGSPYGIALREADCCLSQHSAHGLAEGSEQTSEASGWLRPKDGETRISNYDGTIALPLRQ